MPSIVGTWNIYFTWECSTTYKTSSFVFKPDGTWTYNGPYTGKWVEHEGMLILKPAGLEAVYSGKIVGHAMLGIMTNLVGEPSVGCWYGTRANITLIPQSAAAKKTRDVVGDMWGTKRAAKKNSKKK